MAAPMAGTCDDDTPAMILATFRSRSAARFHLGFRSCFRPCFRPGAEVAPRLAAIAFHRTAAGEHHLGIVFLGGAGHDGGHVLERVAVGRTQLGGEIDVAAELEHAIVFALEYGFALLR